MNNKKLIEVALPLHSISFASVRERPIWRNHPSTLHRWWARRPLAACRAVIFASMVDDPSTYLEESEAQKKRTSLHILIEKLVKWENTNNKIILEKARYEIACSVARSHGETAPTESVDVLKYLAEKVPYIYDPFCGGGTIPLEVQRLGLRARGSDLNPIAVIINKAMIELPPQFHDKPPVNPDTNASNGYPGTSGLADDIRYYGSWIHNEAKKRIGHLYPKATLPNGTKSTVMAWLWGHTVQCPNPACQIPMPLMHTFQLSKKKDKKRWTCPIVDKVSKKVSFIVQDNDDSIDVPNNKTVNGTKREAICVACKSPVKMEYVYDQAKKGKMGEIMTAMVTQNRLYLSPTEEQIQITNTDNSNVQSLGALPDQSIAVNLRNKGITHWHQLYTARQLTALNTFSDLLPEVHNRMIQDGADVEYANSLCTYLAFAIGRTAEKGCKGARWRVDSNSERIVHIFDKQVIDIKWDFAEMNPFDEKSGWMAQVKLIANVVANLPTTVNQGEVYQADAATTPYAMNSPVIITDPPYYNNIDYADLSDFFYVWLRPLLQDIYPELLASMSTPKDEEMIVNHRRFEKSKDRFEELFKKTLQRIRSQCSEEYPTSIFYAYKQQENVTGGRISTGWETMLNAITSTGFQIVATWPIRTENQTRALSQQKNTLASSIVLVCRLRSSSAQNISWGGFRIALEKEMPNALEKLTRETRIDPVDLAQAAIGPGMEIYSRYKSVIKKQDGKSVNVPVREALIAINNEIDKYFEEQEGEFDSYTRFCLQWLMQHGFDEGIFGIADTLAKAYNVGVETMKGRLLTAEKNRVKLLPPDAYDNNHPNAQLSLQGITTWEACHLMIQHLNPKNEDGKEIPGAVEVAQTMRNSPTSDSSIESVERLARLLYNYYDKKDDSQNAMLCNDLVKSWKDIDSEIHKDQQDSLFTDEQ